MGIQRINAILKSLSWRRAASCTVTRWIEALEERRLLSGYTFATVGSFDSNNQSAPNYAAVVDSNGNLFGTTAAGGANDQGTIFEIAQGTSAITTLANFNGVNGADPQANLTLDSSGDLFGTTSSGGAQNDGTVFEIAQGTTTITTLISFNSANGSTSGPAVLVHDSSGNSYGTTAAGGANDEGSVFEIANGATAMTTLASFNGANGATPETDLTIDSSGNLYGTTSSGGAENDGTVFEIGQGTTTITTVISFDVVNGSGSESTALARDSVGDLYGTTAVVAANGQGTVFTIFEIAPGASTKTTLASFNGPDGDYPQGSLVIDSSGNLYGTTVFGGDDNLGTVFEVTPGATTITTLVSFNAVNGSTPSGGLVLDSSGNLYGATDGGGAYGDGTLFELSPTAATHLVFTTQPTATTADVALSQAITVAVEDGNGNVVVSDTSTITLTVASGPPGALVGTLSVAAVNGVATFTDVELNDAGTYTLQAATTSTNVASALTSSASSSFTVIPTLGRIALPRANVAGKPINASVPVVITNSGSKSSGAYTIDIFVDTDAAFDGNIVVVASVTKTLSLKAGKHTTVNVHVKSLPATLPAGTYYVLAEVIDPNGDTSVAGSSNAVTVMAPKVVLSTSARVRG